MRILAIDPGPVQSAWVILDTETLAVVHKAIEDNKSALSMVRMTAQNHRNHRICAALGRAPRAPGPVFGHIAIERIIPYATAVGQETFDTAWWSGRLAEAAHPIPHTMLSRKEVSLHLTGFRNAKEPQINAAVCDVYGVTMRTCKGTKKHPGPLYGIKTHMWAALAVAVTWAEQYAKEASHGAKHA